MKKILILITVLLSLSIFADSYLVNVKLQDNKYDHNIYVNGFKVAKTKNGVASFYINEKVAIVSLSYQKDN